MRVILTHHARQRVLKRLLKKKNPPVSEIYDSLRNFLRDARIIEIPHGRGKNVLFTNGEYTLVCAVLKNVRKLSKVDILKEVRNFPFYRLEAHILDFVGEYVKRQIIKHIESIPDGEYWFFMNVEKDVLYVGREEPLLAVTFRPARSWERTKPVVWAMSIYKEFAEMIFSGEKRWELRKSIPRNLKPGDVVYVYVPRPVRAYVGYFTVGSILRDHPETLWRRVGHESGVDEESFRAYFDGYDLGIAIEIKNPEPFEKRVDLDTLRSYLVQEYRASITPQNVARLKDEVANIIGYLGSRPLSYLLTDYEKSQV
ncbi:MAG: hypothetical protein DRN26_04155 [Thermoplasmata archaeon]|nr:MAG: hypothetical protein DRN26_04155 [Thermoplasmata archaeon]